MNPIDRIPPDKRGHIIAGAIAWAITYPIAMHYTNHALIYAALSSIVVGIAKEWMDSRDPAHHTVDFWDFVATASPGIILSLSVGLS